MFKFVKNVIIYTKYYTCKIKTDYSFKNIFYKTKTRFNYYTQLKEQYGEIE